MEFSGIRWSSPDSGGDPLNPLEIRWIRWRSGEGQLVFFRRKKWAVNAKMCRNANQNTTSFNRNQAKRVKNHPNYGKCKQNKAHQQSKFSEIAHSPIICQSLLDSAGPAQPPPPTAHCHPPLPRSRRVLRHSQTCHVLNSTPSTNGLLPTFLSHRENFCFVGSHASQSGCAEPRGASKFFVEHRPVQPIG